MGSPVERGVGRLEPERDYIRAQVAPGFWANVPKRCEHYWDDRDEEFDDDPVCPCCGGDGMDPMTDYALPCPECGYEE